MVNKMEMITLFYFLLLFPTVSLIKNEDDGEWGPWSQFSSCSVTCGRGHRTKTRNCDNPAPKIGGKNCTGKDFHKTPCILKSCKTTTTISTNVPRLSDTTEETPTTISTRVPGLSDTTEGIPTTSSSQEFRFVSTTEDNPNSCLVQEMKSKEMKPCIFPFQFRNEIFNGCTNCDDLSQNPWCSTNTDNEGNHIGDEGYWGECPTNCNIKLLNKCSLKCDNMIWAENFPDQNYNGKFGVEAEEVNNRPLYIHLTDPTICIWWNDDFHHWWIGTCDKKGKSAGYAWQEPSLLCPTDGDSFNANINFWRREGSDEYLDGQVKTSETTIENNQDGSNGSLKCDNMIWAENFPDQNYNGKFGVEAEVVNKRPLYIHSTDPTICIWWNDKFHHWWIGTCDKRGESEGYAWQEPSLLCPTNSSNANKKIKWRSGGSYEYLDGQVKTSETTIENNQEGSNDYDVECGILSDTDFITGAIHDPERYPVGEWPWMASFGFYEGEKWIHECGASLISNNKFITAAHCINASEPNWQIRVGVFQLNITSRGSLVLDIEKTTVHPSYDGTAYFDIGVIETRVIEINKKIRPICLPEEASTDLNIYKYYEMIIIGWGASSVTGVTSNLLKRAGVRVLPNKECNSRHEPLFTKKNLKDLIPRLFESQILCAGNALGLEGSCKGDSGGPMFYLDVEGEVEKYIQVGIVEGSIGQCGDKNIPGIYVRLDDPEILLFLNSKRKGLKNYQTINYNIDDIIGRLKYVGIVENEVPSGNGTMLYRDRSKYVGQWSNGLKHGQGTFYYSKEDIYKRSKYEGSWKKDERNGFGISIYTDGETYEGYYLNDFRHGKGKQVFSKESPGLSYEGDWVEGGYSGKGVLIWKDGQKYEGDFLNALRHGKGKLVFSNKSSGLSYEGDWVEDKASGKAVYIWKSGEKYEGDFLNGLRHGSGTLYYSKEDVFERSKYFGSWENDEINGFGILTWTNGETYEGDFLNGSIHGKGKNVYSNGHSVLSYEGDFVDYEKSGKGVLIWKDGSKYEGDFLNDKFHGHGIFFFEPSTGHAKHIGHFENGKPNGRGELYWNNGDKYIGQFKDGYLNGEGIKTLATGEIQQGNWENDEFVG